MDLQIEREDDRFGLWLISEGGGGGKGVWERDYCGMYGVNGSGFVLIEVTR